MKKILLHLLFLSFCTAGYSQQSLTLYFDFNRFELTRESRVALDSLITVQSGIRTIELKGHCDAIGSDHYNIALSLKRVSTVRQYLETRKNNNWKWETKGLGESSPVADNDTEGSRQLNRRVELYITRGVETATDKTLTEKLKDSTVTQGSNIILPMINFVGGRHQLLAESQPMLQQLLDAMKDFPTLVIEIQGHICCQPDHREGLDNETGLYNLSVARAREVYNYLIENSIDKSRLSYQGFGHSRPLFPYPERSEEEMTANRRVDIKIIKK